MYKCCECGKLFDEPVEEYEYSEYWGIPAWTGYYVSPCCHETFDEVDDRDIDEEESEEDYAV